MKTKLFFTTLLLGISMSAFCMTARELFNPDYPKHVYGGAKLDSVVEVSIWGSEYHVLFDDKGRMAFHKLYARDQTTQQLTFEGEVVFGYDGGGVYTTCFQHMWNSSKQQWEDYNMKLGDIKYDASGNPLQWTYYQWSNETNTWEVQGYYIYQYDSYGNIITFCDSVLVRDATQDEFGNVITSEPYWSVHQEWYKYTLDEKGRVITEFSGSKNSETGEVNYSSKIEYTYNAKGDILSQKYSYLRHDQLYDEETLELIKDSTRWEISYWSQYMYNAFNNLEKKIEYSSDSTERRQTTYFYSFPSTTTEVENAEVAATPSENYSVILQWPAVAGADTYTLVIRKNGELICTLIFNAQGQLTGISFAPARGENAREAQTAAQTTGGWQYKLDGLEENTEYSYTATATKNGLVLSAQTVFFTTSLVAIENVLDTPSKSTKLIRNGQILIFRDGKTYTLQGQEIKY